MCWDHVKSDEACRQEGANPFTMVSIADPLRDGIGKSLAIPISPSVNHRLRLAATLDDGCVIGKTSRMYSASAVQKF
jgi:hypothetical protein